MARPGRLGVRYDLRRSGPDGDPAAAYQAILQHAARAERAGVDVLWVAERPFTPGALLPAAFPLCAALAVVTERVRVATGVVPLPLHHPLRVAEDAATLDVVSGGRFELGVGLGDSAEGFEGFGIALRGRGDRLEEAVAMLRQAWDEAPLSFAGRHHHVSDVAVHPKPTQRPHPPLWIAARAEAAVQRAARLGTGLLTDSLDAARRFLAARAADAPRGRVTWFVDPGAGGEEEALRIFERGLPKLAAGSVDLLVPARPEAASEDEGLAELARGLRSVFEHAGAASPGDEAL